MKITEVSSKTPKTVVIYSGRFSPPHIGHMKAFNLLRNEYDNVYIATSNHVNPPQNPFTFAEKRLLLIHAGVPKHAIIKVRDPYKCYEIMKNYDLTNTVLIFAVSGKDMKQNPRFDFKAKKDGSPSYFQKLTADAPETADKHGYIKVVPTYAFDINGELMNSASEIRATFAYASKQVQEQMIKDMYGEYSTKIHTLLAKKLV